MDDKIKRFIEGVCNQLSSEETANEVRLEMEDHILNLVTEYKEKGLKEQEAVEMALSQMGDPTSIGRQLKVSHGSNNNMGLIVSIAALFLASLVYFFFVANLDIKIFDKIWAGVIICSMGYQIYVMLKTLKYAEKTTEEPIMIIRQIRARSSLEKLAHGMVISPMSIILVLLIVANLQRDEFFSLNIWGFPIFLSIYLVLYISTDTYGRRFSRVLYKDGILTPTEFLTWDKIRTYRWLKSNTPKGIIHELKIQRFNSFVDLIIKVPEEQRSYVNEIMSENINKTTK